VKIKSLEDLIVWQEARILMKMVYKLTNKFPSEEKYNLVKHMRGCSRNIPGNIAEGFGRFHLKSKILIVNQSVLIANNSIANY